MEDSEREYDVTNFMNQGDSEEPTPTRTGFSKTKKSKATKKTHIASKTSEPVIMGSFNNWQA